MILWSGVTTRLTLWCAAGEVLTGVDVDGSRVLWHSDNEALLERPRTSIHIVSGTSLEATTFGLLRRSGKDDTYFELDMMA